MSAVAKAAYMGPALVCCRCSTLFAMSQHMYEERVARGDEYHCPNGHPQFFAKSTVKKLEEQLRDERERHEKRLSFERNRREQAERDGETARRSAASYKGKLTRVKAKVAAGDCPCCHRSFKDLGRHMGRMHPGFTEDDGDHHGSTA